MAFHLGNRATKAIRYIGFVVLALVVFVFALQLTFPYERVKDKVIDALSEKYDVTISDVERGWIPGRLYFNHMLLKTRPGKDETPSALSIDRLEVDLGLFALIKGTASVNIDAKIGAGHLSGTISISKGGTKIDLDGSDLPSGSLPMKELIGLPMGGKLDLGVELDLPNEANKTGKVGPDWTKAEGRFDLGCPGGCTIGDGKTKLKLKAKNARNAAFSEGGVEFGTVKLDSLVARVDIKSGKLDVSKFELKSGDGEVHIDFSATLAQDLNESIISGCLRFKGSAELQKREPKTAAELTTTGGPQGPDGLFHIKLDGKLKDIHRLPAVCGPATDAKPDDNGRKPGLPPPAPDVKPPTVTTNPPPPVTTPTPVAPPPPPATPLTGSAPPPPPPAPEARPPGPEHEENGSAGSAEGSATPPVVIQ